ncbi:MAG TPA: cytochrome c peroxidase, partial [Arachidicoccus sp.]
FVKNDFLRAVENNASKKKLQQLFLQTRLAYKKIEWAAEYFMPLSAIEVNGAPVPEIQASEFPGSAPLVTQPQGLQVIEALLFPSYDTSKKNELIDRINLLQNSCDKFKTRFQDIAILNWQVFDAIKLEVFRVITLGITGFDAPVSLNSIEEAACALTDLKIVFPLYLQHQNAPHVLNMINAAIDYLQVHKNDFNGFDRAKFIADYANPVSTEISNLEKSLHIHTVHYNRLLRQRANTLFDTDAFDVNDYVASFNDSATDKKIALGHLLFSDPVLSDNKVRSCQTCHQPDKAYTDGLVKNTVFNSSKLLPRNTPTLLNAALQPALFDDSRATTLEEQAKDVIENKNEMHGSLEKAATLLWNDEKYKRLFSEAFPIKNRTNISPYEIQNALGSFIRSLVKLNSRFDEYMRGNKNAMAGNEVNGFNLFMGKAKCGTCHYMPLFNGTPPPKFSRIESEIIGVPQSNAQNAHLDTDMGRYNIIKDDFNKHAFKTPTVRNSSKTAPYMHNGVFTTLEQVMDFYNKGGGHGLGLQIDNQTLPFDKLDLNQSEINDIIAFMKALDSK